MKIQSTIAGYGGAPVTLIGNLDSRTGVLVMVKEVKYREEKISEDFTLVSNLDLVEVDCRFADDDLANAIRNYFTRRAQLTIDILNPLQRYLPDNKIEMQAIDEGGRRYMVSPDIQNGQFAILAAVLLCEKQGGFNSAIAMMDELTELYTVHSI